MSDRKKTILFVDDEEFVYTVFNMFVINHDYNIIYASGGNEALEILEKNNNIDLVLLDMMMPDMYGMNVLREIRNNQKLKSTKIIIQTGLNDEKEIEKATKLGISGFLNKPYDKEMVLNMIDSVIYEDA